MDRAVRRRINTLFNLGVIRDLTDGQLLERYSTGQGEVAELAFAALVERHGPMVLRVCRARLADPHDALDAFQATFLILIEKSRGLWVGDSLGPWLHQVASRTAACALSAAARRRWVERKAAELAAATEIPDEGVSSGWEQALHEEINRLPDRYRVVIVLCDLEGHSCEEAARRIGRPVGTIKSWRARGRERLRQRLIRSGLAPSSALGAALVADVVRATMQTSGAAEAARALADCLTAGVVPASVQVLVKGVLKAMILSKLKTAAAVICAIAFVTAGLGTAARVAAGDPKRPSDQVQSEPAPPPATGSQVLTVPPPLVGLGDETWSLSLCDSIRIGLDNSEDVRVVSPDPRAVAVGRYESPTIGKDSVDRLRDANCVIHRVHADANPERFKAKVMALVRSIEQQYWSLSQQYVQFWAAEKAVEVAATVVELEEAKRKVGRGTDADVAEAGQRREQFNLDLVTKTSDVITTERQLRNILGLPSSDRRRIVPVSVPIEAKLEPDWDSSLAVMLEKQPDVVQARAKAKEAERLGSLAVPEAVTHTFLPDLASQGTIAPSADPANRKSIALESESVRQAKHQATHSLARFFLEIDANYKQYQTAKRLRTAAVDRLNVQRAYYEEGRITIDRFLDAVSQYAQAVAQEARFKTTYNISIVALEEAKGTLLEYDKITVLEHPGANKPGDLKTDGAAKAASFQAPAPAEHGSPRETGEPRDRSGEANAATPGVDAAGRTISFQVTINVGSRPVEIRGSFTVSPAGSLDGAKTR